MDDRELVILMLGALISTLKIRTAPEAFVVFFGPIIGFILLLVAITVIRKEIDKSRKRREKRRRDYVLTHSVLMPKLDVINDQYEPLFSWDIEGSYCFVRALNSKKQFDYFGYSNYLKACLSESPTYWMHVLKELESNRALFERYSDDCTYILNLSIVPNDLPKALFQSGLDYLDLEKTVFREQLLTPVVGISFEVDWSYVSPQGRKSYRDCRSFTPGEVRHMLAKREEEEQARDSAGYQRSLVTPGLRFDVMRRDGFKCCLCGRSASDGVKLEVDHIIPVSRGGKSVMSNLQTLCRDCNRGKSNKM